MKRFTIRKARSLHIKNTFNQLDDMAQKYMETLTTQLTAIHETAPETSLSTGKNAVNILQHDKGQDN